MPRNECAGCGHDFTSVRLFDLHRVGVHHFTYSEGVRMEPTREDGRRCLDADEMGERGWATDARGRWLDPVSAKATRARFAKAA